MAQNGGIAQSAFKDCTKLETIEFVANGLTQLDSFNDADTYVTGSLTNIYKMFAGGDNSFGDNGDGVIQTPTAEKL